MPPIKIDDFQLPDGAFLESGNSSAVMVKNAFDAIPKWFEDKVVPVLKRQWEEGRVCTKDDRADTLLRLGGLVGPADQIGRQLMKHVNDELKPNKTLKAPEFKLPDEARKTSLKAPGIIRVVFKALNDWFGDVVKVIRPAYEAMAGAKPRVTDANLGTLKARINIMRDLILEYVNGLIANKEKGNKKNKPQGGFSAVAPGEDDEEDEDGPTFEEVLKILDDMGVPFGDLEPAVVHEDLVIDLGEDLEV